MINQVKRLPKREPFQFVKRAHFALTLKNVCDIIEKLTKYNSSSEIQGDRTTGTLLLFYPLFYGGKNEKQ